MKFSAFDLDHIRSFRLITTSAAARGAYFALVNLGFTEGWADGSGIVIPGGALRLPDLSRATGLRMADLRTAIREGLVVVEGDDLRLSGIYAAGLEARGLTVAVPAPPAPVLQGITPAQRQQRIDAARRRWTRAPHAAPQSASLRRRSSDPAEPQAQAAESSAEEGGRGENSEHHNSEPQNSEETHSLGSNGDFETRSHASPGADASAPAGPNAQEVTTTPAADSASVEARKAAARHALARALRRQGLPYTRTTPQYPDPLQEWADLLQGAVGARTQDEALAAFHAIIAEARARGLQVQFARQATGLASVGAAALARRRAAGER